MVTRKKQSIRPEKTMKMVLKISVMITESLHK